MKKYRTNCLCAFICLALIVTVSSPVFAQIGAPSVINYQGRLYDPSGTGAPVTGVHQVEFRIWDSLSGGTLIWGRQFPVSCTADGVFNVLLNDGGTWLAGATNQLPAAFLGKDRFLELTVAGYGGAISPRQQMVSAPYAMQAQYAVDARIASEIFTVAKGLTVSSGGATITGLVTLNSGLTVIAGGATITGAAVMNSGLTVHNGLTVNGATTLNSTLQVHGNLTVASPSVIAGYGTIPIGGIILWSGSSAAIPDGWKLCDGANGTPNLLNRFIVGAGGSYAVGNAGGADAVTLSATQIPAHSHPYYNGFNPISCDWKGGGSCSSDNRTGYTATYSTANAGGGQAHENRPPYYALCYIMRVK